MILDSLKNSALYYGVSPRMKQAFELIASTDWTTMEPGIHELDGKDIYVNVMERELKQKPDAKLEIHNEYIDIQVLIRGEEESFGWSERRELKKPLGEFSVENDIQLFDDVPQTYYTMRPGQSAMPLCRGTPNFSAKGVSIRAMMSSPEPFTAGPPPARTAPSPQDRPGPER